MKNTLNGFSMLLLLLTFACGGSGGGGGSKSTDNAQREQQEEESEESTNAFGKYVAFIRPVNTRVHGFINSGKANITVDSDFTMSMIMDDAPGVVHIQSINVGRSCPRLTGDVNKDGYIDIVEAEAFTGEMLIPLDDNLESQTMGVRTYPVGKSYTFNRKGDFNKMMKDLKLPDANTNDNVIKLPAGSSLDLEGRVIVVHGALASANLPATVKTINGLTAAQSIPIACGKIVRVAE